MVGTSKLGTTDFATCTVHNTTSMAIRSNVIYCFAKTTLILLVFLLHLYIVLANQNSTYDSSYETNCCPPCEAGTYYLNDTFVCVECPAGYFCPPDSTAPSPCPAGFFTDKPGLTSCIRCELGYYAPTAGSESCIECPAGKECADFESATPCQEGTYSAMGSSSCSECPAGFFCPVLASAPTKCEPGYYSSYGAGSCEICPEGSYCPQNNAQPIQCPKGQFSHSGQITCHNCPAGKSCSDGILIGDCAEGEYSVEGSDGCELCPSGKECPTPREIVDCAEGFFSTGAQLVCTVCPAGSFCPSRSSEPLSCASGLYSEEGWKDCRECPPGKVCSNGIIVDDCQPGSYSKDGECKSCLPGTYCPTGHSAEICEPGTYSQSGKSSCTECPPGSYCPDPSSGPKSCPIGKYSEAGWIECEKCPAGRSCNNGRLSIGCSEGEYSLLGEDTCKSCPAGSFCETTMTVKSCLPGTYSLGEAIACTACPAGKYCPTATHPPSSCPIGKYSETGSTSCSICPAGFACPQQISPKACQSGFYSLEGMGVCELCPSGYACPSPASKTQCSLGRYSLEGETFCTICPRGSRCPDPGSSPTTCEAGFYTTNTGQQECSECPAGFECPDTGSSPVQCQDGHYAPPGSTSCAPCSPGYWCKSGESEANPSEQACPVGTYCPTGSKRPTLCPAGTRGVKKGAVSEGDGCEPCPAGSFCLEGTPEIQSPQLCPRGHFCPGGTKFPDQFPCHAGTYNNKTGMLTDADCITCPEGKYCPKGTSDPIPCPAGYFCPSGTSSHNQYACPPGTYSNQAELEGAPECIPCPPGSYCPQASTEPIQCRPGTYNPHPEAGESSRCLLCPAGSACPEWGQTDFTMHTCAKGHFCPAGTAGPATNKCPGGTWTSSSNLKRREDCSICFEGYACAPGTTGPELFTICDEGHYCPGSPNDGGNHTLNSWSWLRTHAPDQYPCPPGTYSPYSGLRSVEECLTCPPGSWCNAGSVTPSGPCQAGHFCPEGSDTRDQVPCPPGTFSREGAANITQCELCESGKYSGEGASECIECPAGRYCPHKATTDSQVINEYLCPAGLFCDVSNGWVPSNDKNACPPGTYCPEAVTKPKLCPPGTLNRHLGRSSLEDCIDCTEGFWCAEGAQQETGECDPGHFCPSGSSGSKQEPCPAGTYRSSSRGADSASCSQCPSGYYCPSGTVKPLDCPQGFFCPPGTSTPSACPRGTFSNVTNLKDEESCNPCSPGFFCDEPGQTTPKGVCDAGFFCEEGAKIATPQDYPNGQCPPGHYCPSGSSSPKSCPEGTFNSKTRGRSLNDCSTCTPGFYCSGTANIQPSGPCTAGYFCSGGASHPHQYPSPPGTFSGEQAVSPSPCELGSYNPFFSQMSCLPCPSGYFCPAMKTSEPQPCPSGRYCPENTSIPVACPAGTYNNFTLLQDASECELCPASLFCTPGSSSPSGYCAAGFYCTGGSPLSNPTSSSHGGICTRGFYCPEGSSQPLACPTGTFSNKTGLTQADDCTPCTAGKYCSDAGLTTPTGDCAAGYFCPGGQEVSQPPNYLCPTGSYCPSGSASPIFCPDGLFTEQQGLKSAEECLPCPPGFFCLNGDISGPCAAGHICYSGNLIPNPEMNSSNVEMCLPGTMSFGDLCPEGFFCPEGSTYPIPCPEGTYSSLAGLQNKDECTLCDPGKYCSRHGLTKPSGQCSPGYYCLEGESQYQPVQRRCPEHHYCKEGTHIPTKCPSGTYSNETGLISEEMCLACPSGYYCLNGKVQGKCHAGHLCVTNNFMPNPIGNIFGDLCPAGAYCPEGTANRILCPPGTFSNSSGLEKKEDCTTCNPGYYCKGQGNVEPTGLCSAGFYCPGGQNMSEPFDYICPEGHFCEEGSQLPSVCPPGTYNLFERATNGTGCQSCPAGMFCQNGQIIDQCNAGHICVEGNAIPNPSGIEAEGVGSLCPMGRFCPKGVEHPLYCPEWTFRTTTGAASSEDCNPCPAGSVCRNPDEEPQQCPPGYYCKFYSKPEPCPIGTWMPFQNASSVNDCLPCTAGYFCPEKALENPDNFVCPMYSFCPPGSSAPFPCPSGTHSLDSGLAFPDECNPCPEGFYCSSSREIAVCSFPEFCPHGASVPFMCPQGSKAVNSSGLRTSIHDSCEVCEAGSYGNHPERLECNQCDPGYICLEGATRPDPQNIEKHNGFPCPSGSYCPAGAISPIPCPQGYFSNSTGAIECSICPSNTFNDISGQTSCEPCGPSSYSFEGAATCICNGANRVFQKSDKACLCQPGYIFYNSDNLELSSGDSSLDCQPIVYENCQGRARNYLGECPPPSAACSKACPEGGQMESNIGLCECFAQANLEDICDEDCRETETKLFMTGPNLLAHDPVGNVTTPLTLQNTFNRRPCLKNTCDVRVVYGAQENFRGLYNIDQDFLQERFSMFNIKTENMGTNVHKIPAGVDQPVTCILVGDILLWEITAENYPVYVKDSLLNSNPSFDYGAFRALHEAMQSTVPPRRFMFRFDNAGSYVLSSSSNTAKVMVVSVKKQNERCPDTAYFKPTSSTSLVSNGVVRLDPVIVSPDWLLIGISSGTFILIVMFTIGCLYFFKKITWKFGRHSAVLQKEGIGVKSSHTIPSIFSARLFDSRSSNGQYVDLEDFDVFRFFHTLDNYYQKMENTIDKQESKASEKIEKLGQETNEIKQFISRKINELEKSEKKLSDQIREIGLSHSSGSGDIAQLEKLLEDHIARMEAQSLVQSVPISGSDSQQEVAFSQAVTAILREIRELKKLLASGSTSKVSEKICTVNRLVETVENMESSCDSKSEQNSLRSSLQAIHEQLTSIHSSMKPYFEHNQCPEGSKDEMLKELNELKSLLGNNDAAVIDKLDRVKELLRTIHGTTGTGLSESFKTELLKYLKSALASILPGDMPAQVTDHHSGTEDDDGISEPDLMSSSTVEMSHETFRSQLSSSENDSEDHWKSRLREKHHTELQNLEQESALELKSAIEAAVDNLDNAKSNQESRVLQKIEDVRNNRDAPEALKDQIIQKLKGQIANLDRVWQLEKEACERDITERLKKKAAQRKNLLQQSHKEEIEIEKQTVRTIPGIEDENDSDLSNVQRALKTKAKIEQEISESKKKLEEKQSRQQELLEKHLAQEEEIEKENMEKTIEGNFNTQQRILEQQYDKLMEDAEGEDEKQKLIEEYNQNLEELNMSMLALREDAEADLKRRLLKRKLAKQKELNQLQQEEEEAVFSQAEDQLEKVQDLMSDFVDQANAFDDSVAIARKEQKEELENRLKQRKHQRLQQKHEQQKRLEEALQKEAEEENRRLEESMAKQKDQMLKSHKQDLDERIRSGTITDEEKDRLIEAHKQTVQYLERDVEHERARQEEELKRRLAKRKEEKLRALEREQAEQEVQDISDYEKQLGSLVSRSRPSSAARNYASMVTIDENDATEIEAERLRMEQEFREKMEQLQQEYRQKEEDQARLLEQQHSQELEKLNKRKEKKIKEVKNRMEARLAMATDEKEKQELVEKMKNEVQRFTSAIEEDKARQDDALQRRLKEKKALKKRQLRLEQEREAQKQKQERERQEKARLSQLQKAAEVKKVSQLVETGDIPGNLVQETIEMIVEPRQMNEYKDLVVAQKKHREEQVRLAVEELKIKQAEQLEELKMSQAKELKKASKEDLAQLSNKHKIQIERLDEEHAQEEQQLRGEVAAQVDVEHARERFELKSKHLCEIEDICAAVSPDNVVVKQIGVEATKAKKEIEELRKQMEEEKDQAMKRKNEEMQQIIDQQKKDMEEEIKRYEEEISANRRELEAKTRREKEKLRLQQEQLQQDQAKQYNQALQDQKLLEKDQKDQILKEYQEAAESLEQAREMERIRQNEILAQRLAGRNEKLLLAKKKKAEQELKQIQQSSLKPLSRAPSQPVISTKSPLWKIKSETSPTGISRHLKGSFSLDLSSVRKQFSPTKSHQSFGAEDLMNWISQSPLMSKLRNIESMISKLISSDDQRGNYLDPRDSAWKNEGRLVLKSPDELSFVEYVSLEFGKFIVKLIRNNQKLHLISLLVASSLPDNNYSGNAFRNSFHYDPDKRALSIRDKRLQSVGELAVLLCHCMAHIVADSENLGNDQNPEFLQNFYKFMQLCAQDMFANRFLQSELKPLTPEEEQEFNTSPDKSAFVSNFFQSEHLDSSSRKVDTSSLGRHKRRKRSKTKPK